MSSTPTSSELSTRKAVRNPLRGSPHHGKPSSDERVSGFLSLQGVHELCENGQVFRFPGIDMVRQRLIEHICTLEEFINLQKERITLEGKARTVLLNKKEEADQIAADAVRVAKEYKAKNDGLQRLVQDSEVVVAQSRDLIEKCKTAVRENRNTLNECATAVEDMTRTMEEASALYDRRHRKDQRLLWTTIGFMFLVWMASLIPR